MNADDIRRGDCISVQEIMCDPRYKRFRDMCRELRLEAEKNDLPRHLVFAGVAWDFPTMFKAKVDAAIKKLFSEVPA